MKKLLAKLNSRSGASILLALLLFLVCALAGAAAITASASNVGRYSYLEGDQQQYLSAASAAKLIRSQLDGLKAEGKYSASAKADEVAGDIVLDESTLQMQLVNAVFTEPSEFTVKRNDDTISNMAKDAAGLFKDDLEKFVKSAFYKYITEDYIGNGKELWDKAFATKNEAYSKVIEEYSGKCKYEFTLTCDGIKNGDDPAEVSVVMEISDMVEQFSKSATKDISITVSCEDTVFELTGEVKTEVDCKDADATPIERKYKVPKDPAAYIPPDSGIPVDPADPSQEMVEIPITSNMVIDSEVTVTVSFDIDSVISRQSEEGEAP